MSNEAKAVVRCLASPFAEATEEKCEAEERRLFGLCPEGAKGLSQGF
jgi:hypothetical protein